MKVLLCIAMLVGVTATGQFKNTSFYGKEDANPARSGVSFADDDVIKMVDNMCDKMGFVNAYVIRRNDNVSNCEANLDEQRRPVIYYNARFLTRVKGFNFSASTLPEAQAEDWKTLTIMAHELGHHVNLDLINPNPATTTVEKELRADRFAGHMMHLLGATLEQAHAVMYSDVVKEYDTYDHPARSRRLAAIKQGWDKVKSDGNDEATVKRELEAADKAYIAKNYVEAFPILDKYKYHRLFTAYYQFQLAWCYEQGLGTTANKPLALVWYTKSAERGDSYAQGNLGHFYYTGEGMAAPDYNKARYWWEKAVAAGSKVGQNGMGILYKNGLAGFTRDNAKAVEWYKMAADQNWMNSQYNLGLVYEDGGYGVEKDLFQALEWYRKAAKQGDKDAQDACTRLGAKW